MPLPLHVVILAAGEGKRMHSSIPKVLQPIAARPMIHHVLSAAMALQAKKIHVVYGFAGDQVQSACSNYQDIDWVLQSAPLGTGHAVLQAMPNIPQHAQVLVLYGDVPLISPDTLGALLKDQPHLAVLIAHMQDPTGYGRIKMTKKGRVSAIIEQKDADPQDVLIQDVNTGIITARSDVLRNHLEKLQNCNAQGEYYLTDIFRMAAHAGNPAQVVRVKDIQQIFGANDFWQLAALEREYQLRQAHQLAMQGVHFADPSRFDLRGTVRAGKNVFIDIDALFEGAIVLGDGVHIGPYVRLKDVTLGDNTIVDAHCDLDGVITQSDVQIGPFARLRPETRLGANVHIGNFVETKQTHIGPGSKANHLTYLGDASVGSGVNIGAGTITCNYDGIHKSKTVISDNAFIGSNTSLVAPVQVGTRAVIGAGSVVTQDAPQDALTLARSQQVSIPGWQRGAKKK